MDVPYALFADHGSMARAANTKCPPISIFKSLFSFFKSLFRISLFRAILGDLHPYFAVKIRTPRNGSCHAFRPKWMVTIDSLPQKHRALIICYNCRLRISIIFGLKIILLGNDHGAKWVM